MKPERPKVMEQDITGTVATGSGDFFDLWRYALAMEAEREQYEKRRNEEYAHSLSKIYALQNRIEVLEAQLEGASDGGNAALDMAVKRRTLLREIAELVDEIIDNSCVRIGRMELLEDWLKRTRAELEVGK